ncbi:MAG: Photosystem I reaction center subunit III [Tychonema bourrellyi B0820]|uniref:Photosystem I reaction center subunit III n=1 Tax=Tychonema bourrellyi FEM_GT703 TaxID=2040638 RepID=A0A2G4EXZ0_9CYAN|nr:Photosystem I reaction center subunit III [Tychonema bourrellyi]MDQ2098596.1 Photosystem I reaction center subunit III [Tychonema bourrellyi B0820]PHX54405.1 Photosystem I reaction center subunit III [Tychonema bourrellyi FEM_GT703]
MRRLFAAILVVSLWISFAPVASAYNLVPCKDSPAFKELAENARSTNGDPASAKARFDRYSEALCGPEGYPHLIVDGNLSYAGDFLIPSVLFLYIAGWIGWVGRSYLQAAKKSDSPEEKEIIIDVPMAVSFMLSGFLWPVAALKEITSGEMFAKDDEITVSPR